jgi:hypothetical protein
MRTALVLLALGAALGSGCQATDVAWNQTVYRISEHRAAEKAWRDRRWMYEGLPYKVSFKAGFVAGYRFARGGYDSCEPPMPKHYWRINGITDEDRYRAQAWTDGFTHGTLAAQQDGCATQSALDAAAAIAPQGTPDFAYLTPPAGEMQSPDGDMNYPAPAPMPGPMGVPNGMPGPNTMPVPNAMPGVPPSPGSPGPSPTPLVPQGPYQPVNPAPGAESIPGPMPTPAPAPGSADASGVGVPSLTIRPSPLVQPSSAPVTSPEPAPAASEWQLPVNSE